MSDPTIPGKDWPSQDNENVQLGHGFTGEEHSSLLPLLSIRSNNHVSLQFPQPQRSESSFAIQLLKVSQTDLYKEWTFSSF